MKPPPARRSAPGRRRTGRGRPRACTTVSVFGRWAREVVRLRPPARPHHVEQRPGGGIDRLLPVAARHRIGEQRRGGVGRRAQAGLGQPVEIGAAAAGGRTCRATKRRICTSREQLRRRAAAACAGGDRRPVPRRPNCPPAPARRGGGRRGDGHRPGYRARRATSPAAPPARGRAGRSVRRCPGRGGPGRSRSAATSLSPCRAGRTRRRDSAARTRGSARSKIQAGMVQPGTMTMVRPRARLDVMQPHAVAGGEPAVGGPRRARRQQGGRDQTSDCSGASHGFN